MRQRPRERARERERERERERLKGWAEERGKGRTRPGTAVAGSCRGNDGVERQSIRGQPGDNGVDCVGQPEMLGDRREGRARSWG